MKASWVEEVMNVLGQIAFNVSWLKPKRGAHSLAVQSRLSGSKPWSRDS